MNESLLSLPGIVDGAIAADISPLREFLFEGPSIPLVATGSGGCETVADFAALLYGARGGIASAVTPLTLNSYSDAALRSAKVLLFSKGGHNKDSVRVAGRALSVNPTRTAALFLSGGERNDARKVFLKAGSPRGYLMPVKGISEGFVSTGTALAYFALLVRIFQEGVDLSRYKSVPEHPYTLCRVDGTPLGMKDFSGVNHYIILHGSWGRPVAGNLEGKLVECGLAGAGVYDYRNYCHGRFIYTSNHLEDSAIVLLVTPRERSLAERIRSFLPLGAKIVLIPTGEDAPEAALDLLVRTTAFYEALCAASGVNPACPANPGRIDKRVPINVPFVAGLKAMGPLNLK